ncbi:unnamed protein product, partial [Hymenolepis diminuta]
MPERKCRKKLWIGIALVILFIICAIPLLVTQCSVGEVNNFGCICGIAFSTLALSLAFIICIIFNCMRCMEKNKQRTV